MTKTFLFGLTCVVAYVALALAGVSIWSTGWLMLLAGICVVRLCHWRI